MLSAIVDSNPPVSPLVRGNPCFKSPLVKKAGSPKDEIDCHSDADPECNEGEAEESGCALAIFPRFKQILRSLCSLRMTMLWSKCHSERSSDVLCRDEVKNLVCAWVFLVFPTPLADSSVSRQVGIPQNDRQSYF